MTLAVAMMTLAETEQRQWRSKYQPDVFGDRLVLNESYSDQYTLDMVTQSM